MAGNGRPFQPGQSGNPKGRAKGALNKNTQAMKQVAEVFCNDEAGRAKMLEQYRRGKLHPILVQMMHHYAFGKPKETIEHQMPMRPVIIDLLLPGEGLKDDGNGDGD